MSMVLDGKPTMDEESLLLVMRERGWAGVTRTVRGRRDAWSRLVDISFDGGVDECGEDTNRIV